MRRKLKRQIPGEFLAARYNWWQGPVPGRGPAVEKHCFKGLIITQFDATDALRNRRRPSIRRKHKHVNIKIYTVRCLTILWTLPAVFRTLRLIFRKTVLVFVCRWECWVDPILAVPSETTSLFWPEVENRPRFRKLSYKSHSPFLQHVISVPKCVIISNLFMVYFNTLPTSQNTVFPTLWNTTSDKTHPITL
jgi:hypothetical protein